MGKKEQTNLEIKQIPKELEVIGRYPFGGVIEINDKLYWLRHPSYRWNGSSWGWENDGFSRNDLSEVGFHLEIPEEAVTQRLACEQLTMLKEGVLPPDWTVGIEVEGSLYDKNDNLIPKHDGQNVRLEDDLHPELLSFTVETATNSKNGRYPQTPIEITQILGWAILEGYQVANLRNGLIVYSSVAEGGNFFQAQITPHPYLLSFAPKVRDFTLSNWERIPEEAKNLYAFLGIDIKKYLEETGVLNWPVNAFHVHTGIPLFENLADPRIAYTYGILRQTLLAKVFSFMLYNSCHFYGRETNLLDVRSMVRRLLATTTDSTLPPDAYSLIKEMILSMENGLIHSPSRYPSFGQHDRIRFRAEAAYKTIESIDAPMSPDLRPVLTWVFFNQILNLIGLETIVETGGDESKVIENLKKKWGDLFLVIPTLGVNSSFEADLQFNQYGYEGIIYERSFRNWLTSAKKMLNSYLEKYPFLSTQIKVIMGMIDRQLSFSSEKVDLSTYLGIEKGDYQANGNNLGVLTIHKKGIPVNEIIEIQNQATFSQANYLSLISNEEELLSFFGI